MIRCPQCVHVFSESAAPAAFIAGTTTCPACGAIITLASTASDDAEGTFISDEWPEHEHPAIDRTLDGSVVFGAVVQDPPTAEISPPNSKDQLNSDDETAAASVVEDSIDVTLDSTRQPVEEPVLNEPAPDGTLQLGEEPANTHDEVVGHPSATIAMSPELAQRIAQAAAADATFLLPDANHPAAIDESGGTIAFDGSQHADDGDHTFVGEDLDSDTNPPGGNIPSGIDLSDLELRTIALNYDVSSGSGNPLQTIKSRGDGTAQQSVLGGDTIDTVPFRALGTVGDGQHPSTAPEYELIKVLGKGGMGVVWSARQTSVDRRVAVKMIKEEFAEKPSQRQKFLAEAVVTGDLDHPNIVPIYDVGRNLQGTLFYSMKQVQGTPWKDVIRQKTLSENIEILLRVADAMAFAHARGIIHRDLKPENIMLGEFGEVLVMDWGLAIVLGNLDKAKRLRQTTSMGGTPAYMAPEMATGPIDRITPASDVYLLGAILWEMVTGRPPHPGKKAQECLLAAMRNEIVPTDKTGELIDIARKSLATKVTERHQSVREFQDAVRSYLSHAESIAMAHRAQEDLHRAQTTNDYNEFSKSVFGYEGAIELWPGNTTAAQGVSTAKLAYAENAYQKGDYDLATSLLDPQRLEHAPLRETIQVAVHERDARTQRLQLARRAMLALVAAILVIVTGAFFWIRGERNEALAQKGIAEQQQEIAVKASAELRISLTQTEEAREEEEKQRKLAETNALEAQRQTQLAKANATEAEKQRLAAEANEKLAKHNEAEAQKQKRAALEQEQLANMNAAEALKQQGIAVQNAAEAKRQQSLAEAATEAERYAAYIARIGLAAAKIKENSFDVAAELLETGAPELRNWEWGRLKHLCSQESIRVPVSAPVDAIAISPDGQHFVMASWDHTARIVETATGTVQRELKQEGLYVHAVAWTGDTIATGGSDPQGYIRLWNASSGEELTHFNGHQDAVVGLKFSPDGRWLLSTSYDNTARLWDLQDISAPVEAAVLAGHSWWVWGGAFSPEFNPYETTQQAHIVTVSQDGKAIVWHIHATAKEGEQQVAFQSAAALEVEELATFTEHRGPVYCVEIDPQGRVATAGFDQRILLWHPADVPAVSLDDLLTRQKSQMEFVTLTGHVGPVQSLAFSQDGELLVSGGRDNAVMAWDLAQKIPFKTFRGHSSEVSAVALTPDETRIVSGGKDQQAIVWSIENYEEIRELQGRVFNGHADAVLCARFSADGQQIVTAGRDRMALTWDSRTGEQLHEFHEGHEYLATTARLSPDGQTLFTAAADNTVRIWNVATGTQIQVLRRTGQAAVLGLSPNGEWLVTGDESHSVRLYRVADLLTPSETAPEPHHLFTGHHGMVSSIAFLPGTENRFVTSDTNGRCLLHAVDVETPLWDVKHHAGRITASVATPNGQSILTASHDHTVSMLNADSGEEVGTLSVGTPVSALAISANGQQALTVSTIPQSVLPHASRMILWNLTTFQRIKEFDTLDIAISQIDFAPEAGLALITGSDNTVRFLRMQAETDYVSAPILDFQQLRGIVWSAQFAAHGKSLLTIGGNEARLWDAQTLREQMRFSPHGALAAAAFSPTGQRLVTGSWDNSAKIWDAHTGQPLFKLRQGHTGFINSVVFSPDGQLLLTASDDGMAILWNAETGAMVGKLAAHQDRVRSACFSPAGDQILTTSHDKTAILWDVATQQPLKTFQGHQWAVLCGVFSRDGHQLLTGSEDNTARLWDVTTGLQIAIFEGHTAPVTGVDFSLDGHRIFTASRDTTAKMWDATPGHAGKEVLTLSEHGAELTSLQVSPDGRQVLTASQDGRALLWLTSPWKTSTTP